MTTQLSTKPDATVAQPLLGRVAVVTGSSRGIGASIAEELARAGAHVVVNYVRGADAASGVVAKIEANGGKATAEGGDVTNIGDVVSMFERVAERHGRVDILVNNA